MHRNKPRSSLKKVQTLENEETDPAKSIKRRISFSGKKFIREFNATEIPRDYNNSYEISEHNNDSSGQAHVTAAEMEKENIPQASVSGISAYDRSDFSFQLQTSINVTLLPNELNTQNQSIETTGPVDITSRCSLSVSDVAVAKLRENSKYNIPVTEKTMDLMSTKMDFSDIEPNANRMKDHKPKEKDTISFKTQQEDVKQSTVYFNNDITCDFDNIEPQELVASPAIVTAKANHETEAFVAEDDCMSFLQDESTMSSPLIPLDVITGNGISKKLNFRQLNDALNSGRIQIFPNGPKTPTTDRKVKQHRFWDASEQQPMEQGAPLSNALKVRGTLNFNESMLVSPISQLQKSKPMEEQSAPIVKDKSSADNKRNYRFSQADELMLDNTNFLVHAKVGDETQSRSNSKCSSRRETTYDNTAMEWEDIEKQEAAVAAALEQVKRNQTLHNVEAIDEEQFSAIVKNQKSYVTSKNVVDIQQKWNFNESVESEIFKEREKLSKPETHIIPAINLTKAQVNAYNPDMHCSEQIKRLNDKQENKLQSQRSTPEAIEVDKTKPQPPGSTVLQKSGNRRQTLLLCDSIEQDSFDMGSVSTVAPKVLENSHNMELDLFEPAGENKPESPSHSSRRRQTMHMSDFIEEDFACDQVEQQPSTSGPMASYRNKKRSTFLMSEAIEVEDLGATKDFKGAKKSLNKHRQTLLRPQLIEEDIVSVKKVTSNHNQDHCNRRQTMHMSDAIEEDLACAQEELHPPTSDPMASHRNKKRTTFLLSEAIEVEDLGATKDFKGAKKPLNKHRQTLLKPQLIEEDILSVKNGPSIHNPDHCNRRQTMHMSEAIEEEDLGANNDFKVAKGPLNKQRQTLLTPQLIKEDILSVKNGPSIHNPDHCRRRETMHMSDSIEEDLTCEQEELHPPTSGPMVFHQNKKRTTFLLSEAIEEEALDANKLIREAKKTSNTDGQTKLTPQLIVEDFASAKAEAAFNKPDYCSRRQTMHMSDPIEEDISCDQEEQHSYRNKKRATFLMSEAIEEDVVDPSRDSRVTRKSRQKLPTPEETSIHNLKSLHVLHKTKPMDEDSCSAPIMKEKNRKHRQTLVMSEPIEINTSCIESKTEFSPKEQLKKSRQTLHLVEAIDEDVESFPSTPDCVNLELQTPSPNIMNESPVQDSSCELKEHLAQMRTKTRQTTAASVSIIMENPETGKKRNTNKSTASKTILETPKMNKSHRQNYLPTTPGMSMIEFEEEEEKCEAKCTTPKSTRTFYQSLDMDISCYDSPVAVPKQSSSVNAKRMPIHLTPNLPISKKRHLQLDVNGEMEDLSTLQLNNESLKQDKSRLDQTANNRSRIPVKTKSYSQNSPTEYDGTVQLVRSQLMRQPLSQFSVGVDTSSEAKAKRDFSLFEVNPITISDVSNHFLAQRDLAKHSLASTTEKPRETSFDSRSSNEHSNRNHKKFINLSGDTEIFAAAEITDEDEIEKIQQSLVSTLLDEDDNEDIEIQECLTQTDNHVEMCLDQSIQPSIAGTVNACKKCKHCKLSIDNTTLNAFVLSDWNELQLDLEKLQRMRKRPHIKDMERYWDLKITQFELNYSDETNETTQNEIDAKQPEPLNVPEMLEMFYKKLDEHKARLPKPEPTETFVKRLKTLLLAELPNWIFDYQLQCDNTFIFTHRKISTFQLSVIYEPVDYLGAKIRVHRIKADTVPSIPKEHWTVHEQLRDFQLRLKLPLNIIDLLDGNDVESFFKFLKHMDALCLETGRLCTKLHLLLISLESRLLRETNRNVVRKVVHKTYQVDDELYTRLERVNYIIHIGDVEEISFRDILQPPIYMFDEKIQFLPKGIDFLETFLQNPEQYLKVNS